MSEPHLLVRADANSTIGIGHVMRCLALAQAWQERGGRVTFLSSRLPEGIAERLRTADIGCLALAAPPGSGADAAATLAAAVETGAEWIAVDGYQFDAAYQGRVKQGVSRVLWIDDYGHAAPYCADLVVNQNLGATAAAYGEPGPATRVLAGGNYAMLRREFRDHRPCGRQAKAERVLVTLGGGDPDNVTGMVLEAADKVLPDTAQLRVVVGAANPNVSRLENLLPTLGHAVELIASPKEVAPLMDWSELAITAAGSTCWELMCLGVPLIAISIAENQKPVAQAVATHGAGLDAGWHTAVSGRLAAAIRELAGSPEKMASMAQAGPRFIDGRGALRVVAAMRGDLEMRPATMEDARMVWEWANEPAVRAASFHSQPIAWEQHRQWFAGKLADNGCRLLIAEQAGLAVGQIRFDSIAPGEAEVDVSVNSGRRGKGYGAAIIRSGAAYVFEGDAVTTLHAWIKADNAASIRAFCHAGFEYIGEADRHGHRARHYVLQRKG